MKLTQDQVTKAALEMHRLFGVSGYSAAEKWLAGRGYSLNDKRLIQAEFTKRLRSCGEGGA